MAESPFKPFELHGKTALVTGGAGLLGRQFCLTLAAAGAAVVVADVQGSSAHKVAEEVKHNGDQALAVEVDISNPPAVHRMMDQIMATYDDLDILVNCAAIDPKFDPEHREKESSAFETYPYAAWQEALNVNLSGVFLVTQAAVKPMLKKESGVIINVGSIYGMVGPDQRIYEREDQPAQYKPVHYSVTKAGLLGLTRYLAAYYRNKSIRVNALSPGGVFLDHEEAFVESYSARTILGRMAGEDELNGALLFLASDASSYMTGANLVVDGGWTAW